MMCDGFIKTYRTWTLHGEASFSSVHCGNCDASKFMEQSNKDDDIPKFLRDLA
jgi:hypothetical protein